MKQILFTAAILLAATTLPLAQSHSGQQVSLPLHLTGTLISAGGIGNPTGTGRIEITVNRWTSTDDRAKLVRSLTDGGEKSLLHDLMGEKAVGTVRFNTQLAWDLRYARATAADEGGTRVFLATDRPMSAFEIWNQPRYSDYPFTLIDLRLNPNGQSTGSLMLAARVNADEDGRFIQVENFATQPITISQIEIEHQH